MKTENDLKVDEIFNIKISIYNNSINDIDILIESNLSDNLALICHDSKFDIGLIEKFDMKFFNLRFTPLKKGLLIIPELKLFDKFTSKYFISNCYTKIFINN
jgi:hypothetical protein